ncbi:MAG TPA: hypothetical protein VGQ28_07550 [Thermoanaerobaculia bacterium]|jgi:hypothetical protein|nr:hypothetical protein [Thermoanaerobaculia bacterium]
MLSWACRRFRARFTPGFTPSIALPHRRACPDCHAYATAVEQAAGARLPLPASLRRNLRALAGVDPGVEPGAVLPFPVPRLAVPDDLALRLRRIATSSASARPPQPAPPEWVRSPRAAIAASVLLALLFGPLLAGAADRGQQALRLAHREVAPLVEDANSESHEALARLRLAAGTAWGAARQAAALSMQRAQAGLSGLSSRSARLFKALPHPFTNPDPRRDADGSSRRSR